MTRYKREGYPRNNGLVAAGLIARKHNRRVIQFCRRWWQETKNGCYRDQLSFNYVLWKYGDITINKFPFGYRNSMFILKSHKKQEDEKKTRVAAISAEKKQLQKLSRNRVRQKPDFQAYQRFQSRSRPLARRNA